jgi:hypothetical protein
MSNKIEFRRDKTGKLIAYKNGEIVGEVTTMGDLINKKDEENG